LDQPVATFENEPNLEIMQRLSKRCVQTGSGKQKMLDGGKRALEWITAKHGGDETHVLKEPRASAHGEGKVVRDDRITACRQEKLFHGAAPCSQCYRKPLQRQGPPDGVQQNVRQCELSISSATSQQRRAIMSQAWNEDEETPEPKALDEETLSKRWDTYYCFKR
jgi:hypothetical protein